MKSLTYLALAVSSAAMAAPQDHPAGYKKLIAWTSGLNNDRGLLIGKVTDSSFEIWGVIDEAESKKLVTLRMHDIRFAGLTAGMASTESPYQKGDMSIHGLENKPLAQICGNYEGIKAGVTALFLGHKGFKATNPKTGISISFFGASDGLQIDYSKISFTISGCDQFPSDYIPKIAPRLKTEEMNANTTILELSPTRWLNSADNRYELVLKTLSNQVRTFNKVSSNGIPYSCSAYSITVTDTRKSTEVEAGNRYIFTKKESHVSNYDYGRTYWAGFSLEFTPTSGPIADRLKIYCNTLTRDRGKNLSTNDERLEMARAITLGEIANEMGVQFE